MACPKYVQVKRSLCKAIDGLFHPSIFEEEAFCKNENFKSCAIYQLYVENNEQVTVEDYANHILDWQIETAACSF